MAFPTIPTVAAGRVLSVLATNPAGTHTSPNLSSLTKNAGDLLIAIVIIYDGNSTNAEFSSWGGGFTEFGDFATTTTMAIGCASKVSTGSETGTFTVTSADTSANDSAFFLLSIPGGRTPEAGSYATGTGAAADPASFDPAGWGAEDTLWIAVGGSGETSTTGSYTGIASAPANYSDYADSGISADVVGGVEGAVAFRQLNAASEDVGTFSVDTSNARNAAIVIAVRTQTVQSSFTANLVVRKTQTGSFTADAVIKKAISGSISANADIKQTISGSITADAVVVSGTISASFTANAVVKATISGSFTANAVVRRVQTSQDYAETVRAHGAIAQWRLGEPSGTTAEDSVGSNDGTYVNTPTLGVAGPLNDGSTAVTLDRGQSEYVDVVDHASIDQGNGAISWEAWFKRDDLGGSDSTLISKGGGSPILQMNGSPNGIVRFFARSVGLAAASSINITDQNWHHFVGTKDASHNWKIYIDGVDRTVVEGTPTPDASSSGKALDIGRDSTTSDAYADGTIAEVALYSFALSSAQIVEHYQLRTLVTPLTALTADAAIRRVQASALTANAVIKQSIVNSVTSNAVIFKVVSGSFTANAVILVTQAGSLTANSLVLKTISGTFSADAFVHGAVLYDTMTRSVSGGLGTADDGTTYNNIVKTGGFLTSGIVNVNGTEAVTSGSTIRAFSGYRAPRHGTFQFDFFVPSDTSDLNPYYEIDAAQRDDDTSSGISAMGVLFAFPNGDGTWRVRAGASAIHNFTPEASTWYTVKGLIPPLQTDLARVKVWKRTDPEPAGWNFSDAGIDYINQLPTIWLGGGSTVVAGFDNPRIWTSLDTTTITRQITADARIVRKQKGKVIQDIANSIWYDQNGGTQDIFQSIDETTPNDADYIRTDDNPVTATYEGNIQAHEDPNRSDNHIMRVRHLKTGDRNGTITVTLFQETVGNIASFEATPVQDTANTLEYTLTGAEADAITDYTRLRVRFVGATTGGGSQTRLRVTWFELEVPGAAVDTHVLGFIANSIVRATIGGTFSANAFIAGTVTADAVVQRTQAGSFIADAVVFKAISGSTTADAVVFRTQAGAFTADAEIALATQQNSFTANAVILGVIFGSLTANTVILRGQQGGITSDAVVHATEAGSTTADAVVLRTQTGSVTADAVILATIAGSITGDAVVLGTQTGSFSADAFVHGTIRLDAVVLRPIGGQIGADAFVHGRLNTDAVVRQTIIGSFSADAFIGGAGTGALSADAVIQATVAGELFGDAVVLRTASGSFSADAIVVTSAAGAITANAVVLRTISGSFGSDAIIESEHIDSFTSNAVVRREAAGSVFAEAVVAATNAGSLAVSAVVYATLSGSLSADAVVQASITDAITADALIRTGGAGQVTADAVLLQTIFGSVTGHAVVLQTFSGSITFDSITRIIISNSILSDAFIVRVVSGAFTADADILNPNAVIALRGRATVANIIDGVTYIYNSLVGETRVDDA